MSVATFDVDARFMHPADIVAQRFSIVRKGYDPDEVHEFLRGIAEQVSRLQGEVQWQKAHSEHLERRTEAAQEAAYARLSRDFMDVVGRADEAATRVRADAESQARAEIGSAHREAGRLMAAAGEQAEMILAQARADAERIRREAGLPSQVIEPPRQPVADRSFMLETGATATPRSPAPRVLSDSRKPPNGSTERRAQPEDADMNLDLDVSLFDLFDDLG